MSDPYHQLQLPLEVVEPVATTAQVSTPSGYRGLYAFHKYWGKKPFEPISFLIGNLTDRRDVVLDPFVGSGVVTREAYRLERRFVGIDLNPVAVKISELLISPPEVRLIERGLAQVEECVRQKINTSYKRENTDDVGTHYLWENKTLRQIWVVKRGRGRQVYEPTDYDLEQFEKYRDYKSRHIRPPRFFSNSRINASLDLTLNDLFTGRALRNMDLLLGAIKNLPLHVQPAFHLCLTAASGQMSRMVFAITGRGKTKGRSSTKIEVGSWAIGYWRPKLCFELNVWNCFARRVRKLALALKKSNFEPCSLSNDPSDVLCDRAVGALCCDDALKMLEQVPASSIDLILTDPPHSDRVPYLELSEMWNAMLGYTADFEKEIVVSNARERQKGLAEYNRAMRKFLSLSERVLKNGRCIVILFNARDAPSWEYLNGLGQKPTESSLEYRGHFPLSYSAGSVVQDSRKGGLKNDFALVFQKPGLASSGSDQLHRLKCIQGWSDALPGKQENL